MKFNKKITVTALSTVLGLGLVGSISGAVAWYQYSTRATTSIIGTSAGKGGTLQISADNGATWVRDLITQDVIPTAGEPATPVFDGNYQPVTFGALDKGDALPSQAYKQPVYGEKDMTKWAEAADRTDYYQYSVELQALQLDGTEYKRVQKPVYLSDITIKNHDGQTIDVSDAVRVHIAVVESERSGETDGGKRNFLISKSDLGTSGMPTNGKLDLDGDGKVDQTEGYEWETRTDITYGEGVQKSHYSDESGFVATKDSTTGAITGGTIVAYTPATTSGKTTLTITIWLEGWAQLDPYTAPKATDVVSMWDPANRNGAKFDVGFTFDVGDNAF